MIFLGFAATSSIYAAFSADKGRPTGVAINQDAEIQLLGNISSLFHKEAMDRATLRSRLMSDQRLPDEFLAKPATAALSLVILTPPALPRPPA